MKGRGVILAAHGSRYEPAVNALIRSYAAAVAQRRMFDEVAVAFHQGHPAFHEVIDEMHAPDIVVVPLMTSAGYYSDLVLPRELRRNRRYPEVIVRQTMPLGLHPRMADLARDQIRAACEQSHLSPAKVSVAIVGHGTPKHAGSRSSTEVIAAALQESGEWGQVLAAFLDEEPFLESVCDLAEQLDIIVIPFLIGAGPHAISDIPVRLGIHADARSQLPVAGEVNGRNVRCEVPIGSDPRVIEFIIDLATSRGLQGGRRSQEAVA